MRTGVVMPQKRHYRRAEPAAHPRAERHPRRYHQRLLQPHQRRQLPRGEAHRPHQRELQFAVSERRVGVNQESERAQNQQRAEGYQQQRAPARQGERVEPRRPQIRLRVYDPADRERLAVREPLH